MGDVGAERGERLNLLVVGSFHAQVQALLRLDAINGNADLPRQKLQQVQQLVIPQGATQQQHATQARVTDHGNGRTAIGGDRCARHAQGVPH